MENNIMEFLDVVDFDNDDDDDLKNKKINQKKSEEENEDKHDDFNFPYSLEPEVEADSSYSYYHDLEFQKAIFYSTQLGPTSNNSLQGFPRDVKMKGISRGPIPLKTSCSYCVICNEATPAGSLIQTKCLHIFCEDCIKLYLYEKIQENILSVKCPEKNCEKLLDSRFWSHYVPEELFDRWIKERTEGLALAYPRSLECPKCEGEFSDDGRGFLIRACPKCWNIFCMKCRLPWHMGITCEEVKVLQLQTQRFNSRRKVLVVLI